jgi:hypothetical protein
MHKRRVQLWQQRNMLKRLLGHVAAFNLGLVLRKVLGQGTPQGLQGYPAALFLTLLCRWREVESANPVGRECADPLPPLPALESLCAPSKTLGLTAKKKPVSTTGC